jgi:hypothetical protein
MADIINKLTDKECRHAMPNGNKPAILSDGQGLYLQVIPSRDPANPSRSWVFLYKIGDKKTPLGLGPLASVSLTEAREKAKQQRALLDQGD